MTHYGKIKSYDRGQGLITPESGGDPLSFAKADLQQKGQEPKVNQRYGYQTSQVDGRAAYAVNLRLQEVLPDED
jgi:CspA family cold shock protein